MSVVTHLMFLCSIYLSKLPRLMTIYFCTPWIRSFHRLFYVKALQPNCIICHSLILDLSYRFYISVTLLSVCQLRTSWLLMVDGVSSV